MPQAENTDAPRGHHHLPDAELRGERDGMHAAAAAEGDQREVARVVAAIERDQLQRVDHVVVGDADDAARRLDAVDAELGARRVERVVDRVHVGVDLAAAEIVAVDAAEREIGVGGRRLVPPRP